MYLKSFQNKKKKYIKVYYGSGKIPLLNTNLKRNIFKASHNTDDETILKTDAEWQLRSRTLPSSLKNIHTETQRSQQLSFKGVAEIRIFHSRNCCPDKERGPKETSFPQKIPGVFRMQGISTRYHSVLGIEGQRRAEEIGKEAKRRFFFPRPQLKIQARCCLLMYSCTWNLCVVVHLGQIGYLTQFDTKMSNGLVLDPLQ